MLKTVFSEFELRAMGFKFDGDENYSSADCVGSCEESMNVKIIAKKCRGVVKKEIVKGDGTGTLKVSLHIPYDIYIKMHGMQLETLIDGVNAYGQSSRHKTFGVVQDVYDEDGNEKLKAYPNCIVKSGVSRKIENGAEEVAELELEISVMPDDYGNGMYEAPVDDLINESIINTWMTEFTPDMVQNAASSSS